MEKSKRSEETLNTRMKHEDDYGVNEDSNLSHSMRASHKEDSQRTTTLTDNKKERLRKRRIFNAWRLMHWHQLRSHVPQVFRVTSHIVGFRSVLRVVNSIVVAVPIYSISDLYANSLQRFTLRKRVFWGVVFIPRRLQQTAVNCKRSNCNKIENNKKTVKVARLRVYPKTANNRSPRSIMSLCMHPHLSTFSELLRTPPGITPLPPTGGRTRWFLPLLILPEWHWLELSFSRFLV